MVILGIRVISGERQNVKTSCLLKSKVKIQAISLWFEECSKNNFQRSSKNNDNSSMTRDEDDGQTYDVLVIYNL